MGVQDVNKHLLRYYKKGTDFQKYIKSYLNWLRV